MNYNLLYFSHKFEMSTAGNIMHCIVVDIEAHPTETETSYVISR